MKRIVLLVTVVLALVAAGAYYTRQSNQTTEPSAEGEQVTVERGIFEAAISATGNVEAAKELALSFRTAGRVAEILVEQAQQVEAGQELARLDSRDLAFAVAQAEANVAAQAARVAQLESPPRPSEVKAAEAVLASARHPGSTS